jgi:hypothetical protein
LIDSDGLLSVYHGIVYPFLSYGVTVWGHSARKYMKRVFMLQKWWSDVFQGWSLLYPVKKVLIV